MVVDEAGHRGDRRSSSTPKKTAALLRILLAPAQLAHLALELLHVGALFGREAGHGAGVDLRLADPMTERFGADPEVTAPVRPTSESEAPRPSSASSVALRAY